MKKLQTNKWMILLIIILIIMGGFLANLLYDKFKSKEFLGCKNLSFEATSKIDNKIFHLMEEKKYKELITLGNKHLKDDELWYCDPYFWNQRARAFYNLGDCVQAQIASIHAIYVTPIEANKPEREFYDFVRSSNICHLSL